MVAIVNGPSRFLSHEPLVGWHWQRIDFFVQPDAGKCMEQIVTCPNLVERTMRHASREPPGRTGKAKQGGCSAGASDSPDQLDSRTGRSHGLWEAKRGRLGYWAASTGRCLARRGGK
jgi:hypothetical protein